MRESLYRLYGMIFKLFNILPVKKKKVVLYLIHNSKFQGNLRYIYDEMKRRDQSFRFIVVSKEELFGSQKQNRFARLIHKIGHTFYFYVCLNYHFATAEYIGMNDNFLPLAYMPLKKEVCLFQVWHGAGAFKRFGLSTETDPLVRRLVKQGNQRLCALFVTSSHIIPYYEEAFGVKRDVIYPVGVPVIDSYYNENNRKKAEEEFYAQFPELKGKRLILYTPTFRGSDKENEEILSHFDGEMIREKLGEEYRVLVRLHPQIHSKQNQYAKNMVDVTNYKDIKQLYYVSDLLINDYSSVVVEYAILQKPIYLYAYDLEQYDRGFYEPFEELVPGPIVKNMEQLIAAMKQDMDGYEAKRKEFLNKEYDYFDADSTKRVVDIILNSSGSKGA